MGEDSRAEGNRRHKRLAETTGVQSLPLHPAIETTENGREENLGSTQVETPVHTFQHQNIYHKGESKSHNRFELLVDNTGELDIKIDRGTTAVPDTDHIDDSIHTDQIELESDHFEQSNSSNDLHEEPHSEKKQLDTSYGETDQGGESSCNNNRIVASHCNETADRKDSKSPGVKDEERSSKSSDDTNPPSATITKARRNNQRRRNRRKVAQKEKTEGGSDAMPDNVALSRLAQALNDEAVGELVDAEPSIVDTVSSYLERLSITGPVFGWVEEMLGDEEVCENGS